MIEFAKEYLILVIMRALAHGRLAFLLYIYVSCPIFEHPSVRVFDVSFIEGNEFCLSTNGNQRRIVEMIEQTHGCATVGIDYNLGQFPVSRTMAASHLAISSVTTSSRAPSPPVVLPAARKTR